MSGQGFEDRFLIRELYGRYAMAVARRDGTEWLECWGSDATWKTPHFEVTGRTALEQMWGATWNDFESVTVFNEVGAIAFSGEGASTLSNVFEVIALKAGGAAKMTGLYADRFVYERGAWRFSYRGYESIAREASPSAEAS